MVTATLPKVLPKNDTLAGALWQLLAANTNMAATKMARTKMVATKMSATKMANIRMAATKIASTNIMANGSNKRKR